MSTFREADANMTPGLEKCVSNFGFGLEFFSILNFHNQYQSQKNNDTLLNFCVIIPNRFYHFYIKLDRTSTKNDDFDFCFQVIVDIP